MCGLKAHALETEITGVSRSLLKAHDDTSNVMVIEIGAATTKIAIGSQGKIVFTRSLAIGGLAFTRAVAQDLGFSNDQAEQYKQTYGLDTNQLEGKIAVAIKPIFDVITNELRRAIAFWAGKHPDRNVTRFIVTGGSSRMPGLIPYLTETIGLEGQLGDSWADMSLASNLGSEVRENSQYYSIAVGLALKDLVGE
jgi:type IV pilus assembly protein PilM